MITTISVKHTVSQILLLSIVNNIAKNISTDNNYKTWSIKYSVKYTAIVVLQNK